MASLGGYRLGSIISVVSCKQPLLRIVLRVLVASFGDNNVSVVICDGQLPRLFIWIFWQLLETFILPALFLSWLCGRSCDLSLEFWGRVLANTILAALLLSYFVRGHHRVFSRRLVARLLAAFSAVFYTGLSLRCFR